MASMSRLAQKEGREELSLPDKGSLGQGGPKEERRELMKARGWQPPGRVHTEQAEC